jgi:hypothetical protein
LKLFISQDPNFFPISIKTVSERKLNCQISVGKWEIIFRNQEVYFNYQNPARTPQIFDGESRWISVRLLTSKKKLIIIVICHWEWSKYVLGFCFLLFQVYHTLFMYTSLRSCQWRTKSRSHSVYDFGSYQLSILPVMHIFICLTICGDI